MNRRSLILGMAGILAAASAPAIVRGASIMPILAPIPERWAWKWVHGNGGIIVLDVELDSPDQSFAACITKPENEAPETFLQRALPMLKNTIQEARVSLRMAP